MGFSLRVKGDAVVLGGKPRSLKEESLQNKYGDTQYDAVKAAFKYSLQSWKGHEDELNRKAFHMYENFRPTVANGQKGLGSQRSAQYNRDSQCCPAIDARGLLNQITALVGATVCGWFVATDPPRSC
jgi:hypothetical protein